MPYRTVQNYLSGNVSIPVEFAAKTCDVLGIEADYLLFGGVDVERTALHEAVTLALEPILPRLEISERTFRITEANVEKPGTAVQHAFSTAVAHVISAAIRDEYITLRLDDLGTSGKAGISPQDARSQAYRMDAYGLTRGGARRRAARTEPVRQKLRQSSDEG